MNVNGQKLPHRFGLATDNKEDWNLKKYTFDGVDEYMTVANNADLNGITTKMTVAFWGTINTATANYGSIVAYGDDSDLAFQIDKYTTNIEMQFGTAVDGVYRTVVGASIYDVYGLIVVVYDGTQATEANRLKFYWNGVSQTIAGTTGTIPTTLFTTAVGLNVMRGFTAANAAAYVSGDCSAVAIYSNAFTQTEVNDLYNSGSGVEMSNIGTPVAYYKMGDPSHTFPTVRDETNSNDGTLTNMESGDISDVTAAAGTETWTYTNTDMRFVKSSTQYGIITNHSSLNFTTDLTVAIWCKFKVDPFATLAGFVNYGGSATNKWNISLGNTGILYCAIGNGSGVWNTGYRIEVSGSPLVVDTEYLIIMSYDAGTDLSVYINNVDTGTPTGTDTGSMFNNVTDGNLTSFNGDLNHSGKVDVYEIGIWNAALTSGQASNIWNSGAGADMAADVTPVAYYKINNNDATASLADATTNTNNMALTNAVASDIKPFSNGRWWNKLSYTKTKMA